MSNVSLIDGHIDEPKMTDEEIIKALECCEGIDGISYCNECPLCDVDNCVHILSRESLNLINRKDEEIDELQHKIVSCNSEAIKEFAELIKKAFPSIAGAIDYFVKEMVGE